MEVESGTGIRVFKLLEMSLNQLNKLVVQVFPSLSSLSFWGYGFALELDGVICNINTAVVRKMVEIFIWNIVVKTKLSISAMRETLVHVQWTRLQNIEANDKCPLLFEIKARKVI